MSAGCMRALAARERSLARCTRAIQEHLLHESALKK